MVDPFPGVIPFNFSDFPLPNQRVDIYYGRELEEDIFGFHFGLVHSSEGTETDNEVAASMGIYSFGVGLTLPDHTTDIAVGIDLKKGFGRGFNHGDISLSAL
ncbi:unnamed protein product [marine sediment metagenome]|uniref:Uncharacterized protein n=1 Tax=marine sediment metagenome TaxID=412755 RepID=X0XU53_9ZZZZ